MSEIPIVIIPDRLEAFTNGVYSNRKQNKGNKNIKTDNALRFTNKTKNNSLESKGDNVIAFKISLELKKRLIALVKHGYFVNFSDLCRFALRKFILENKTILYSWYIENEKKKACCFKLTPFNKTKAVEYRKNNSYPHTTSFVNSVLVDLIREKVYLDCLEKELGFDPFYFEEWCILDEIAGNGRKVKKWVSKNDIEE